MGLAGLALDDALPQVLRDSQRRLQALLASAAGERPQSTWAGGAVAE